MKMNLVATVLGLGLTASLTPLLAHHSVAAQFDINKTITLQGTVAKTEWLNPHARVWVDAKNDDGTVSSWEVELPPPANLMREGVTKDFLKQGDQITLNVWRAKDGSRLANALTLTLPDGRILKLAQWMVANPIK
jgi:Family of unknown function (DUF6152)